MKHAHVSLILALCISSYTLGQDSCPDSLVYQAHDPTIDSVAKVLARGNERQLILGNGSDFSSPCDGNSGLMWWLGHEVQAVVTCHEKQANSKSGERPVETKRGSFLQRHRVVQGTCPPCSPDIDKTVKGYFQSMSVMSVRTIEGKQREPERVLVIGLGGGVLPSWLLAKTHAHVDVVDISKAVVDASSCFGIQTGPRITLHVADGRGFLVAAQKSGSLLYDTIMVDAFDGSASMPVCMRSVGFFDLAAERLTSNGVLLLNLLTCASDHDKSSCGAFRNSVVASVQQSFKKTYLANAPGALGSQSVLVARKQDVAEEQGLGEVPDEGDMTIKDWFHAAQLRELGQQDAKLATYDADECARASSVQQ